MMDVERERYLEKRALERQTLAQQLASMCDGQARVTLEIGCGHGHFLVAYAQAHPGELCLGFDVMRGRIERALHKAGKRRLTNLYFLKTDAELFFEALPDWVRIDKTFILFSDPWPKAKHHKNRLMQDKYLRPLAQASSPDAKLYFRTDHEGYFSWSEDVIEQSPFWKPSSSPWPFEYETIFQEKAGMYFSLVAQKT